MSAEKKNSYEPVDVQKHPQLQKLFETEGITVRKNAETLARSPSADELGSEVVTYVKMSAEEFAEMQSQGYSDTSHEIEGGVLVVESRSPITEDRVISRNPQPLGTTGSGDTFYNDWTQPKETWLKNYGAEPTGEFAPYKKTATNRVLKVDSKIMEMLCGDPDAQTATIAVSWSPDGQEVYKGGYVVDAGYGLEQGEYDKTYEVVTETDSEEFTGQEQKEIQEGAKDILNG